MALVRQCYNPVPESVSSPSSIMLWVPRIPEFPVQVVLILCKPLPLDCPREGRLHQARGGQEIAVTGLACGGGAVGMELRRVYWGILGIRSGNKR